jgi:WD40 repeat protein/serine/threonine protein kinase
MSDNDPSAADPFGQIADEFVAAFRQGKRPSVEEFARRYPAHADEIRDMLPALVLMEKAKSADDTSGQRRRAKASTTAVPLSQLGDYQLLREVGRGGMGVVYEAQQLSLGRHVAIKVLPSHALLDPRQLGRFQREARSAAKLHHTNIVPVFGVGEQDGLHYYVMQFIPGLGLDEVLEELKRLQPGQAGSSNTSRLTGGELRVSPKGVSSAEVAHSLLSGQFAAAEKQGDGPGAAPEAIVHQAQATAVRQVSPAETPVAGRHSDTFSVSSSTAVLSGPAHRPGKRPTTYWQSVARIGVQVADALEYAHRQGILHRDIKPSNLLVDTSGTVWVTDFGLAKADDQQNLTHTGDVLGTLRYLPPEAFEGRADARGDLYSLGLTLYELLCLQPAFDERERKRLIKQVTTAEPARLERLNRAVPRDLVTIVHKAIERDPAHRYPTAGALAADLQRFLDDEPIQARRQTQLERYVRWARHHPGIAVLGGVLTAVLVLATVASLLAAGYFNRAAQSERAARQEAESSQKTADESRLLAENSEQEAQRHLYRSLVGEARALRQARGYGFREKSWQLLHQALLLETPEKDVRQLRQEAVACMGDYVGLAPTIWQDFEADIHLVALQPHGAQLAVGLSDGSVLVRNIGTGADIVRLREAGAAITALHFGPDGSKLVTGDTRGTIKVWESTPAGQWNASKTLTGDPLPAAVTSLAITPDGRLLAAGFGHGPTLSVWSLADGKRQAPFQGSRGEQLGGLAFSPQGDLLAAAYDHLGQHGILLWDVASRQLKPAVLPSLESVAQVVFSPNGRHLAATCGDAGIVVYDTHTFQRRLFVAGYNPIGVAFSPDSQLLAIPSIQFGVVRLWNVSTNREVAVLSHPGDPRWVEFSTDGRALVTAHPRSVRIWNLAGAGEKVLLSGHEGGVPGIAFSPDGKLLASVGKDRTAAIWDPTTGRVLHRLTGFGGVLHAVAFSPDSRLLAIGDRAGGVRIWEVGSWQELPVPAHRIGHMIWSLAFSPDGRYFAACGLPGGLTLWRLEFQPGSVGKKARLKLETVVHFAEADVQFVSFSPDSNLLIRCIGTTAQLWDLRTARPLPCLPAKLVSPMNSLAFRPDGKQVLVIGPSLVPEVWDVVSGQRVFAFPGGQSEGSRAPTIASVIALSLDGSLLAQQGTALKVWDLENRKLLLVLPEERSTPWCMAWSPDKRLLAVGLEHGGIAIWNLPKMRAQLSTIGLDW